MPAPDTGTLAGRAAIVTGAGQGGGRGAALALAAQGTRLMLFGRTAAKLEAVADEARRRGAAAAVMAGDVADAACRAALVAETLARFGGIRILVNAAQAPEARAGAVLDADPATADEMWRSGFVAQHDLMRRCHPHMRAAGGGSIVNFGSAAQLAPEGFGVYAGVKAAIAAMSRAAAVEWGRDNVRVNVVLPLAQSPAQEAHARADPEAAARHAARVPLGRIGDPELDIGRAVAFLAGPDSSFITGTVLALNGGGAFVR